MSFSTTSTAAVLCLCVVFDCVAQQSSTPADTSTAAVSISTNVPRVIRVTTTSRPTVGLAPTPVEGATLAIYRDEVGGAALWQETLNMNLDTDGHYTAMLGSTKKDGIPIDLFTSGEPRWLGVQFNRAGEAEQPRVLLGSVPYALKAVDAETLGGHPASDYLLAPAASTVANGGTTTTLANSATVAAPTTKIAKTTPLTTSGNAGYIAQFTDATDLGNSMMFNSGGYLGIGTTTPTYVVDMLAATSRYSAMRVGNGTTDNRIRIESNQPYSLGLKNGSSGTYAWMGATPAGDYQFSDQNGNQLFTVQQTGNVGVGTASPITKLDVSGNINFSGNLMYQGNPVIKVSQAVNGPFGNNLGLGVAAVQSVTTGIYNTGIGWGALLSTTTTNGNTAVGYAALNTNTGSENTAIGNAAMQYGNSGQNNTAIGNSALYYNSTGQSNTGVGSGALGQNTSGSTNTAYGYSALSSNSTGSNNIAIGANAAGSVSSGSSNNIHIASTGSSGDSGVIRIGTSGTQGSFFVAGVRGVTTGNNDAISVVIDSNGQLGTVSSSRRFKEDIQDMGKASLDLMRLRPVTYRYKQPFADGSKPIQYGLIAEEVAEVYPELVAHSANGQIETVKYQVLDTMMLNELQREQNELQTLQQALADEQAQNRRLLERLARLETAVESIVADPVIRDR